MRDFYKLRMMADNANEVANFLKEMLREMVEPVCPFALYPRFRDMEAGLKAEDRLDAIIEILQLMPVLNRNTLLYLARFFQKISTYSKDNMMPAYNLAVVVTPNLFRSKELTAVDLSRHGTLVDIFIVMMENTDRIIKKMNEQGTSLFSNLTHHPATTNVSHKMNAHMSVSQFRQQSALVNSNFVDEPMSFDALMRD